MKSVLFLGKKDDLHCKTALEFLRANFATESYLGKWGQPLPETAYYWKGDYIISYLSRWIVPQSMIDRAAIAAINFHPASPGYPGIGCNNFALFDEAAEYGVTCHFMAKLVDTGEIIATKLFPVYPTDDVASLLSRTYVYQLSLFYDIAARMLAGDRLIPSGEKWTRSPRTRKELNELGKITPDMPDSEIARRIRATRYGQWAPELLLAGRTFRLAT